MGLKKYRVKSNKSESIEAEEIFLDAEAIRSIEDKGKMEKPIKQRTFVIFFVVLLIGLFGLMARAGYLQVVQGEYYKSLATGNKMRIYTLAAPRGIIYDLNYETLVYNVPSFDLLVSLADFSELEDEKQISILQKIAEVLEKDASVFDEKISGVQGQYSQLLLEEKIEHDKALQLETLVKDWPGIRLEKNALRDYIYPHQLSHIVGYTGRVSAEELASNEDFIFNEYIGKTNLELQYQDVLRGQAGQQQLEVDSVGHTVRVLAEKPEQPGNGLVLNIDANLQNKLYESLSAQLEKLKLTKAAAVAIDPRTGGVLALVSLPSFDSNIFTQEISDEQYSQVYDNPSKPLFNRVLAGQYPSGSTLKPLIAAAALQEEIVSTKTKMTCTGGIQVINQYNPGIVYNFNDWKTHGITDIIKAIAESCNVFFYTVGGGNGDIEGLGINRISKYLNLFGLGTATGIDLNGEEIGLIPDKEWKMQNKEGEPWYVGDTYHVSIGQGDLLVTPLQLVSGTAAIANGGTLYRPQIVDKIVDQQRNVIEDIAPEVIRQNFIDPQYLEIVRKGMRQAVVDGSAWALANLTVTSAGKTGTAQYGNQNKTHAWFTGFAPYDDPEIVIAVLIEDGGEGSAAAAPVAAQVIDFHFSH